ncbi:hypothetical protein LRS06_20120 [Hymenobacter sp. J193]|uniref:hypothetical protein n=1 Tax=Hymenobacter sp. J193 TaxID=2898429 RepID=UPI002151B66A|nr:hypothetical protein [Hymenobacter sp. J193]MCR5890037.1 hypothetical protein [Hymenobacter sp. J193]
MPFDLQHYPIDERLIPWGLSLAEVEQRLAPRQWLPAYGGWPNLHGACRSVLGLAAVELNLRAPARHKPVMQVSYELAPPPGYHGKQPVDAAYWVQPLTQLLGPPTKNTPLPGQNPVSSNVVHSVIWQWPTLRVSLSVFGGIRRTESGLAAAGLFLDWQDELTAARPFYEAAQAQAADLNARAEGIEQLQLFELQQPQSGFYMPDYGSAEPHAARQATQWRQSQRALYREGLCETPTLVQNRLQSQQVALWAVPGQEAWAVSNCQDTIVLTPPNLPAVELLTLRPAKGAGAMLLSIGSLHLQDAYSSPTLTHLAAALEQQVGVAVSRAEDSDC